MFWKQKNIWFTQSNNENKIPLIKKIVNILLRNQKSKKNMFFSSKNHKCIYFRLHSKSIKQTYLFLIKSIDIKYLMVDLVLYITHIYFGVHKSKKIRNENSRTYKGTQPLSVCSLHSWKNREDDSYWNRWIQYFMGY